MVQIVQGPRGIAESLGTGLGSGLQQLAQMKLEEMQNQKSAQQLQSVFDFTPEEARFFSRKENQPLFLEYLKRGGGGQQQPQGPAQGENALSSLRQIPTSDQMMQEGVQNILKSLGTQPYNISREMQPNAPQAPQPLVQQAPQKLSMRQQFMQPTEAERIRQRELELKEESGKFKREQALTAQQKARQESIEKANKPFNDMLAKEIPLADKKKSISEEMLKLWQTGKVASGYSGLIPKIAQNTETQRFLELGQDLATILASSGSGVATNFKIKLATERKANPQQAPEAQLDNIVFMINESDKMLKIQEIRNKLIQQNDGLEPQDLDLKVRKEYFKEQKAEQNKHNELIKELGNPKSYSMGTVVEKDGEYYEAFYDKWRPLEADNPRLLSLLGEQNG